MVPSGGLDLGLLEIYYSWYTHGHCATTLSHRSPLDSHMIYLVGTLNSRILMIITVTSYGLPRLTVGVY